MSRRSLDTMNIPSEYREYLAGDGPREAFLSERPLYMVLWPLENIERYNFEYEVPIYAPGFLSFGTNGGGELLVFDSTGAVFSLPAIGMDPKYALPVANSWAEFAALIKPHLKT
jgi:hypothetical protein